MRFQSRALNDLALTVTNLGAFAGHHDPVAVFEIADSVGERRKRNRIRTDIHRIVAETDRERRAAPRADKKIGFAGEQESQREGAAQTR